MVVSENEKLESISAQRESSWMLTVFIGVAVYRIKVNYLANDVLVGIKCLVVQKTARTSCHITAAFW